jgi:hypothetical protein
MSTVAERMATTAPYRRVAVDADGSCGWRTRLMPRQQATSFARALLAHPSTLRAEAIYQPTARVGRNYYVLCIPRDDSRRQMVRDVLTEGRRRRAEDEGRHYVYARNADQPQCVYCLSTSGEVYELWLHGGRWRCDCPDAQFGARRLGCACKHEIQFNLRGCRCEGEEVRS